MSSLGSYLSGLREQRGLSLDEMARSTRVATRYLEALEADDFVALPPPVFAKGFIRAYCHVLGVAPDEALARYSAVTGEPVAVPGRSTAPLPASDQPARGRSAVLVSFVLLVVLGVTLFAVSMFLQSTRENAPDRITTTLPGQVTPPESSLARSPASGEQPAPQVAAPVISPAPPIPASRPLPEPMPVAEPRPTVSEPRLTTGRPAGDVADTAAAVSSPYRLIARVSEPTWIRVRMEDGRLTEETIPAGQVREWVSNAPFVLTVGNAGGVTLELNGRELPPLGARGAVISRLVIPPTRQ